MLAIHGKKFGFDKVLKMIDDMVDLLKTEQQESVSDTKSDFIVSLAVNRAASSKAMSKLEGFYVDDMGTSKTHDATENGATKKCFLWPGASVNIISTSFKVVDFQGRRLRGYAQQFSSDPH